MMTEKLLAKIDPAHYSSASVLAQAVGENMLACMEFMTLQPRVILDLGCKTGGNAGLLAQRYPEANIYAIDSVEAMLHFARKEHASKAGWWCADEGILPLRDQSVDLIFANLAMPWYADLKGLLQEWRRVLRPEGLLMFSSLGPDTLSELRAQGVEGFLPGFVDVHDIGDELTRTRFADPVLEVEVLTVNYRESEKLIHELKMTGMIDSGATAVPLEANAEGVFPVSYEVIYGHAWGPDLMVDHTADENGEVRIPLSHLRHRRTEHF